MTDDPAHAKSLGEALRSFDRLPTGPALLLVGSGHEGSHLLVVDEHEAHPVLLAPQAFQLMPFPSPGSPKTVSTPQSASLSTSTSAAIFGTLSLQGQDLVWRDGPGAT